MSSPSDPAAAWRAEAQRLRDAGDMDGSARALRQLRRLTPLKPKEHRQLFRHLRRAGGAALLDRYLATLRAAAPTPASWRKVALAYWSEGCLPDLLAWAPRHPQGLAEGAAFLQQLAEISARNREQAVAQAIGAQLAQWAADTAPAPSPPPADAPQPAPAAHGHALADLAEALARTGGEIDAAAQEAVHALAQAGWAEGGAAWAHQVARLRAAAGADARLPALLARALRRAGARQDAAWFYLQLPVDALDARGWHQLAQACMQDPACPWTLELCVRAATQGGPRSTEPLARRLASDGRPADALALWAAAGVPRDDARAVLAWLRLLRDVGEPARAAREALDWFGDLWPLDRLDGPGRAALAGIGQMLVRIGGVAGMHHLPLADWLQRHPAGTSRPAAWTRAMLLAAAMDRAAAVAEFAQARALPDTCPELDLDAEIAALHARHGDFGAARDALARRTGTAPSPHDLEFAHLAQVEALCGAAVLFPECLLDLVFEVLRTDGPLGYTPQRGHVLTISGTLAQGGSERQTVNIIRALAAEPRVLRQTVLVRSIEGKHGFFWPALQGIPAETVVYGAAWRTPTDLARTLPELRERPRLRAAIDLLPLNWREEIARLLRLLLDARPAAVHVRQDLPAPAVACAIAGVPVFFIHRGSLARNTWDHWPLDADTLLRPMRHAYRLLLAHTGFFFVNNSGPGAASDQAWLGHDWPERFHVVHNAVEFDQLGDAGGPNLALRASLGIPAEAPVVGGMFRMTGVKRPLLWIEVARQVLALQPAAHFIVAGEHADFGAAVQAYAAQHGFADRLHLPGPVSAVGEWYRCFDLLLLTSDREGLPNVNIEAQHFGLPVVSADVGGAGATLLDGVTGFLVPPHAGAAAFAACVDRVLRDGAWRAGVAGRARAHVHGAFGSARAVRQLLRLYRMDGEASA